MIKHGLREACTGVSSNCFQYQLGTGVPATVGEMFQITDLDSSNNVDQRKLDEPTPGLVLVYP